MSKIFELFGYPLSENSLEAQETRKKALCPFMGSECDGGGNRYLSSVNLKNNAELAVFFDNLESVPAGICSLQLQPSQSPWIVCPRRLFFLAKSSAGQWLKQRFSEQLLLAYSGYAPDTVLGIWSELRISYQQKQKSFQYTFDYVLIPLASLDQHQIESATNRECSKIRRQVELSGYALARRNGLDYVDNFPVGEPLIVEVMTSSTSGGNKDKRTTIPMAFGDALMGRPHTGPGINYRQVWARMVSQLIVKSEAALAWGGKTIWVLQDLLVDYISSTTACAGCTPVSLVSYQ